MKMWIVGALSVLLVCPSAWAQSPPGVTLAGSVTDQSQSVLPGATVTVAREDGVVLATTQAGRDGTWVIRELSAGRLRVSVQLPGFKTAERTVVGEIGHDASVAVTLDVGGYTDQVTVTASRQQRALASVPASVGVVAGAVLEHAPGVNLVEALTFVPGVVAGNVAGVDDLRISIRGAGIRAGFGSRGVILMTDGFPVTEPDGQTPHFDGQIDLASAERIEVVKGPSSALYGGAALGGVVNVVSRTPLRTPAGSVRVEAGSFGFGKVHTAGSMGAGPFVVRGTFGYTHVDGFREHNSLRDWVGTGRADWTSGRGRAVFTFLATDARLELPGTLNRQQFEQDSSQVRSVYVTNNWRRENALSRFGGRYERELGKGQSVEVSSHGQMRDLLHPIFVVIDQAASRHVGSGRYRLVHGRHAVTVGTDLDTQWVDDRWFVNVGGAPRVQIRDDANTVTNLGVYAQDEITLGGSASMTLGVRADRIRYRLDDLLLADGDASDRRAFNRVSPKIGVTARVRDDLMVYGNVASGFEAPTLGEVRLPAGFNETVKPQRALSVEGGVRGQAGPLAFDAAVYRMVVDDEILPQTISNVTVYRNVAQASHTGVELSLRARATRSINIEGTYAYSRFILDEFGVFSGNGLPGIPPHLGTVRASYASVRGWDGSFSTVFSSTAYVNDANLEAADQYGVVSAGAGYRLGIARLFLRGDNLGNSRYTNRPQVNDADGFYYYPAPGRNASAGVEVRW